MDDGVKLKEAAVRPSARHQPAVDPQQARAIVGARHGDPFAFLGMHQDEGGLVVRAMLPGAVAMAVLDETGAVAGEGEQVHPDGLFVARIAARDEWFRYRLRVDWGGVEQEFDDAYRFPPVLGELDLHLLAEGTHLDSYRKLGAHPVRHDGVEGVAFAVWAPNAHRVSVVGAFDAWDGRRLAMRKRDAGGFWEIFVPGIGPGEVYKYEIVGADGVLLPLKADPYAAQAEHPPRTASVVAAPNDFLWQDGEWLTNRGRANDRSSPISIYEVHLGSWRRNLAEGGTYLSYRELAEQLVPYVADLGFTHIEIMPVTEYPFDGSWGYQPVSLFAPTSRYGTPDDFRSFVDACHRAGIGVWLDWVPGHFPSDSHGLARFDGTALYEHADPRQGLHRDWGTLIYNYGRREVANFLLASALCWVRDFHIDGLRVDAVASMLYLDYSRQPGEWIPNQYGGRENLDAIAFLRRMNEVVFGEGTGATTVAEESTAWPMVSRPLYVGGLGFGFKWNMGWMHDTLNYMARDPIHRMFHHNDLTFGLLYAFHENFILPLSHDETVYGKGSLIGKMPGDQWQRFANLRAYFAFMWTHPGKKLLFMGGEFAQEREWNHDIGLDWQLFDNPLHAGMHRLVRDLNWLYREVPALHQRDCEGDGFSWVDASNGAESVVSYLRRGEDAAAIAVVVCNFTPVPRHGYRIGVPSAGWYRERVNTDAQDYGGSGVGNFGAVEAELHPMHGRPFSLCLNLPPLAAMIFTIER
ncbi:MAG TPA: 1,4-alpha-glucan branching protein GlgB [Stellaceae bacterium]|nr:1,4-alpha-glucan branching protein GlgB [Stellaceae bacterium]